MLDDPRREPAARPRIRRLQVGILPLMALVACCGAFFWVARTAWEDRDFDHTSLRESVRALRSRDVKERLSAALELGQLGASAIDVAAPALITALKDPEAGVRAAAAEGLGRVVSAPAEARAAVRALVDALHDGDPAVRAAAADALRAVAIIHRSAKRGPLDSGEGLDVLTGLLRDGDARVRSAAIRALGPVGQAAAVGPPRALAALLDDPSADVRGAAALAIADFDRGLDRLIPRLLRLMEQDGRDPRTVYWQALNRIKPGVMSPAIVPGLAETLRSRDRDVRCLSINFLAGLGPLAQAIVPALIQTMNEAVESEPGAGPVESRDPSGCAAWALGQIALGTDHADAAIAALSDLLRRGHARRRRAAARALTQFSPDAAAAIPALVEVLGRTIPCDAPASEGGEAIAKALGEIAPGTNRAGEAIEALGAALEARSDDTRLAAINSLRRFGAGASSALPRLRKLGNDPRDWIRAAAAAAVAELAHAP
jgi:HEAT repeat protein